MRSAVRQDAGLGEKMERIVREVEDKWLSAEGHPAFKVILRKRLIAMGPSKNVQDKLWPENVSHVSSIISEETPSPEDVAEADTILSEWAPTMKTLPEWLIVKARLLSVQGLPAEGLEAVETALSRWHNKNPQWLALSARLLIEAGRPDEGMSRLEDAVALEPRTAVLWEEIGDALAAGKDYDGALAAYEKCLSALPGRLDTLKKIGDCYAAAGHPEAARMAYDQVQTLQGRSGAPKDGGG
jgi:tetratricopeptide (TPR) repeat protein